MEFKLKELEDSDIEILREWLDKPYISKWFYHKEEWIREVKLRKTDFNFITHYIFMIEGIKVGFCQYYDYSKGGEDFQGDFIINHTASIDYMIGEEKYIGKHYSKIMINLLEKEIFKNTDFMNIIVNPDKENLISRKTLLSCDYRYDSKDDIFIKFLKENK